jgi:hypothetical protein
MPPLPQREERCEQRAKSHSPSVCERPRISGRRLARAKQQSQSGSQDIPATRVAFFERLSTPSVELRDRNRYTAERRIEGENQPPTTRH